MAGETIGLIDDDPAVRRGLTRLLGACDYHVETYDSAAAFLGRPPATVIDCLLVDLRLPGMTGLDLYDRLMVRGFRVPIIFITGHADALIPGAGRGPLTVLVKPFDDDALLAAIHLAVRKVAT